MTSEYLSDRQASSIADGGQDTADWIASRAIFMVAWGLPILFMAAAIFTGHPVKTVIWAVALTWMGAACLMNARRCRRRHCFYTGPFFLIMAAAAALHGYDIVPLGTNGWRWLGLVLGIGGYMLWVGPERIWGRYRN